MKTWPTIAAIALISAGLVLGTALAQDGQQRQADRLLAEFDERGGSDWIDEDLENLTAGEMVERGEAKVGAMRVTLESVTELLEHTRETDRDILKINCINENLASMKGFVNVGEQSYESLQGSAGVDDMEAAKHHYTLVSIAGQRVTALGEQARVCAGEELRYADDAVLEVSIDPRMGAPDRPIFGRVPDHAYARVPDHVLDRLPPLTPFR